MGNRWGIQRCHEMFRLRLIYCCKTQSQGFWGVLGKHSYLWEPRTRWYKMGVFSCMNCEHLLGLSADILKCIPESCLPSCVNIKRQSLGLGVLGKIGRASCRKR